MKKRAQLLALILTATALTACDKETAIQRRGPQGAVTPADGTTPPSGSPTAPGASWDGLSDRVDTVWGF